MTRLNKFLLGLLAVQLVLAIFVLLRSGNSATIKETPVLPGFDVSTVTRVQIADATSKIDLVKQGNDWVLASHFGYPADAGKVTSALAPLAKVTAGDPVATSAARYKQLKVADDDFERKLIVTANGKDTTILLGAPAGIRRTALRLAGEDRVLAGTGISASSFSASPRDWIAPKYIDVPRDDIAKVEVSKEKSSFVLDRSAPPAPAGSGSAGSGVGSGAGAPPVEWRVSIDGAPVVLAAGEKLESFAIETILSQASSIEANPADPKRDPAKPIATVTLTRKDGKTVSYDVLADGDTSYWIKDKSSPRATKLERARIEAMMGADRSKLVAKPEPPPGSGSGSAAPKPPNKP